MLRPLLFGLLALAGVAATCSSLRAEDTPPGRILMITQSKGFQHGSVTRLNNQLSASEQAMTQLGQQSKLFTVVCSQDSALDFTKENLQKFNIVAFYTTGELPIAEADLNYFFNDWLKQPGHGFVGFHSATDTYGNYEPYWDMVGGNFNGHPWNADREVTISVHDAEHPATRPLAPEFVIKDEIYQYRHWQPEKVRVLMSLNMAKTETKAPYMVPVAWVKEYGQGRVFVTNLGHNESTWADKRMMAHVEGGLRWVLGLEKGDATPNPELSAQLELKAKADTEAAGKAAPQ